MTRKMLARDVQARSKNMELPELSLSAPNLPFLIEEMERDLLRGR
jgi:hypothetical protein